MSPVESMAMLPIQRKLESGAKVDCWATDGVPLGFWISYHRTPLFRLTATVWFTTRDSWSPKFRYARRYIRRSASESSCVDSPDWITQPRPPLHNGVKGATGILRGPVKVELAGVVKSAWNLYRFREFTPKFITKFGEPAGGGVWPSRSEGRRLDTVGPCWKQT